MNTNRLHAALGAALMLGATLAAAQPGPRPDDDRRGPPGNERRVDHERRGPGYSDRGPQHGDREGRGFGSDFRYHKGDRLPPDLRGRNYVVDDWRAHRLSAPPRGYHWVQYGGDYVLVAIATGVIASILLNN
ncbi:RcnB family protein [Xylophilus sp.]|uniref:RcnB family protein n=1 Tax=Xylophilus sp. TaxID=2653893 RepID=UPI002D7E5A34|nr:RcnB family protein [Xylophilus sp.]